MKIIEFLQKHFPKVSEENKLLFVFTDDLLEIEIESEIHKEENYYIRDIGNFLEIPAPILIPSVVHDLLNKEQQKRYENQINLLYKIVM